MRTIEIVRCPNCGSPAERHRSSKQTHTQCHRCDYLLTLCTETGRVIEAYAPGIPFRTPVMSLSSEPIEKPEADHKPHQLLNL